MQEHSAIGERILARVDTYPEVAQWCVTTMSASTARATRMV